MMFLLFNSYHLKIYILSSFAESAIHITLSVSKAGGKYGYAFEFD